MSSRRTYLCTCKSVNYTVNRGDEYRHLKFHETEVDADEICIHCGHYAWEKPQHTRYPRGAQGSQVPWVTAVKSNHTVHWIGEQEKRMAYYEKTMFSDHEVDTGDAFTYKTKDTDSFQDELRDLYIRWGGNSGEGQK